MVTLKPLAPFGMVLIALLAIAALAYPLFGAPGTARGDGRRDRGVAFRRAANSSRWRAGGLLFFAVVLVAVLAMRGNYPAGQCRRLVFGSRHRAQRHRRVLRGRLFGGPKLAPTISPAKTVVRGDRRACRRDRGGRGFLAVLRALLPGGSGWILSVLMGVVGQAGDLTESAIKRMFRIKDSGDVIPGHGGFMDRLDSVSFGAAVRLRRRRSCIAGARQHRCGIPATGSSHEPLAGCPLATKSQRNRPIARPAVTELRLPFLSLPVLYAVPAFIVAADRHRLRARDGALSRGALERRRHPDVFAGIRPGNHRLRTTGTGRVGGCRRYRSAAMSASSAT